MARAHRQAFVPRSRYGIAVQGARNGSDIHADVSCVSLTEGGPEAASKKAFK